jgi:hypothetical protein
MRRPWIAAAIVLTAAAALAAAWILRRRPEADAPTPPQPPPAVPAAFRRIAGELRDGRAAARALLAFPDALEVALREGSRFAALSVGDRLEIRLDEGEAWIDLPERPAPLLVRTPHATVSASRAGLDVRCGPKGTTVTVAHGTVLVAGSPYRQEISREEAIDVTPEGGLGKAVRIDPSAAVAWAAELRAQAGRLPNGGFEDGFARWTPGRFDEAEVRLDRRAHAGRQAAFVRFNAVRDYEHAGPASDPFSAAPGAACRLTGYVEHADLDVGPDGGIAVEVRAASGFVRSTPLWSGSSGWKKFSVDFELPRDAGELRVVLTRARNGSATQGTLRLDELALFELSP